MGIRHNNHHANRRTPKLIQLYEIFSTLLHRKPIRWIADYKQQQMLYQASSKWLRTERFTKGVQSIKVSFVQIREAEKEIREALIMENFKGTPILCLFVWQKKQRADGFTVKDWGFFFSPAELWLMCLLSKNRNGRLSSSWLLISLRI